MKKVAALVLFLCSCSMNQRFVTAVGGYSRIILPEYKHYVQNDTTLEESSKEIRIRTAEYFEKLIDEARE